MKHVSWWIVLAWLSLISPRVATAQWMTREVTACTDVHPSPVGCYRVAVSAAPSAIGFGTDVKVWLANLQGAESVFGKESTGFSSLFYVGLEFRSSYGTSFDSLTTNSLEVAGNARQVAGSLARIRVLPGAFTMYLQNLENTESRGIGGCRPEGSWAPTPAFANGFETCGDGSWVTYAFSTTAQWSVTGIGMTYFSFGNAFDDGTNETIGSQLCYSQSFNGVPPNNCNILADVTYQGTPTVVSEPSSFALVLIGLPLAVGMLRMRRTGGGAGDTHDFRGV
jgi:hypothetical protein